MGEHKGTLTIIIAVLLIFGAFVALATGVLSPMLDAIGDGFSNMVDSVFSDIPSSK